MAIQVLGARITLAATFMFALEFLVRIGLDDSSTFLCRLSGLGIGVVEARRAVVGGVVVIVIVMLYGEVVLGLGDELSFGHGHLEDGCEQT